MRNILIKIADRLSNWLHISKEKKIKYIVVKTPMQTFNVNNEKKIKFWMNLSNSQISNLINISKNEKSILDSTPTILIKKVVYFED